MNLGIRPLMDKETIIMARLTSNNGTARMKRRAREPDNSSSNRHLKLFSE